MSVESCTISASGPQYRLPQPDGARVDAAERHDGSAGALRAEARERLRVRARETNAATDSSSAAVTTP